MKNRRKILVLIGFIVFLWIGFSSFVTVIYSIDFFKNFSLKNSNNITHMEKELGMSLWTVNDPFILFASNQFPLTEYVIIGKKAMNESMTIISLTKTAFEINYYSKVKNLPRTDFTYRKSTGNTAGCILQDNNVILCDFNMDDIWDFRVVFKNKIKTYSIFIDGSWQECVSYKSGERIATVNHEIEYQWNNSLNKWIVQKDKE